MAQLVKLYDYISRYETNPFHYPSQYIRLKQENWRKLQERWKQEAKQPPSLEASEIDAESKKFNWNPFKRKQERQPEPFVEKEYLPRTRKQLKQYFLNQLFPVQMKWATSTLTQASFTKVSVKDTNVLKFFLQRFPDIYLLLYYPVLNIKNAPIDGDIILIGPYDIEILSLINKDPETTIVVTDDRKWTLETENTTQTMLSPVISLKRTEQLVRSILNAWDIEMAIRKTVVSENNQILYSRAPYQIDIIGKRDYKAWFEAKRSVQSSLKSVQLKAMSALLEQCQTTSVRRPEWEKEQSAQNPPDGEGF